MENGETPGTVENLRFLPSIDALLRSETAGKLLPETGAKHLTVLARSVIDGLRREIQDKSESAADFSRENLLTEAEKRLEHVWRGEQSTSLQRVINATGVIIHTNLGRAPLSEKARQAIFDEASRYCNLEYNLETGKRGRRGARAEHLLAELTGAESALIVNNCAAAAYLVLTVLAAGGEVVISRGEMVEIGGDFRVPDVLAQSGARLREVGTTNRTRASDYALAVTEATGAILRVHPSNFRIEGFVERTPLTELVALGRRFAVPVVEDLGSGFSPIGPADVAPLAHEPTVQQSVRAGVDVVCFS